jgi:hypothetical protein
MLNLLPFSLSRSSTYFLYLFQILSIPHIKVSLILFLGSFLIKEETPERANGIRKIGEKAMGPASMLKVKAKSFFFYKLLISNLLFIYQVLSI